MSGSMYAIQSWEYWQARAEKAEAEIERLRTEIDAAVASERERIACRIEQHLGLVGALAADHVREDAWPSAAEQEEKP